MICEQIINPDDFKDAKLLANRQARRNIIEDAERDEDMENAGQDTTIDTRPTKTVTNEIVVNVRRVSRILSIFYNLWAGILLRSLLVLCEWTLTELQTAERFEIV